MTNLAAIYRCLACLHRWRQVAHAEWSRHASGYLIGYSLAANCPACGHDYVQREGWGG